MQLPPATTPHITLDQLFSSLDYLTVRATAYVLLVSALVRVIKNDLKRR